MHLVARLHRANAGRRAGIDQIAYLSEYYTLEPGDLIYSGTPAGVGPVKPGDEMHAGIDGVGELKVKMLPAL